MVYGSNKQLNNNLKLCGQHLRQSDCRQIICLISNVSRQLNYIDMLSKRDLKINVFNLLIMVFNKSLKRTINKNPKFHLISWCGNFVERSSFRRVSDDSTETLQKLCLSTKFPPYVIRWKFVILCSGSVHYLKNNR